MNVTERLRQGRQVARKLHKENDEKKLGNLRAGNSGILSENGDMAGGCARKAHLRTLGIEIEEPTDSTLIMFQLGTANEDVVLRDLQATLQPGEVILREEEIPIEWLTSNGTKVTGRPDIVICEKVEGTEESEPLFYNKPKWGLELKSVASVWTARDVLGEGPKLPHLIQAAHYSWKLGVPFFLVYKQYGKQAVEKWASKMFPRPGEKNSEFIEYNEKGEIRSVLPFEIVYELSFDSSSERKLRYREESPAGQEKEWQRTLVSQADIERFFEFSSRMAETGQLGSRPMTIDSKGKEKNYTECAYCPLQKVCDSKEKAGYQEWLAEVRKETDK